MQKMTHSTDVGPMVTRRVLAVVPDLFFATRISETGARIGIVVELCASHEAPARIRRDRPDLVILDLHGSGDPLALARALKADPDTRDVPLVGFYSHVDRALRDAALLAGVDQVLARSAFTVRLPDLLAGRPVTGEGATEA